MLSLYWLYIIFRLYFGVNTIWYLHIHFVCDKLLYWFAMLKIAFPVLYFGSLNNSIIPDWWFFRITSISYPHSRWFFISCLLHSIDLNLIILLISLRLRPPCISKLTLQYFELFHFLVSHQWLMYILRYFLMFDAVSFKTIVKKIRESEEYLQFSEINDFKSIALFIFW